jgi:hypothetical protein
MPSLNDVHTLVWEHSWPTHPCGCQGTVWPSPSISGRASRTQAMKSCPNGRHINAIRSHSSIRKNTRARSAKPDQSEHHWRLEPSFDRVAPEAPPQAQARQAMFLRQPCQFFLGSSSSSLVIRSTKQTIEHGAAAVRKPRTERSHLRRYSFFCCVRCEMCSRATD